MPLQDSSALLAENQRLRDDVSRLSAQLLAAGITPDAGHQNDRAQSHLATAGLGPVVRDPVRQTSASPSPTVTPWHRLSKPQVERYSRHLLLPSFGVEAQRRVCQGSVLIVGCGGLGAPSALYLAAAGVGHLGLVDHDSVELSNLHRQIIHTESRVGVHKALSAQASCHALNSLIQVDVHLDGLGSANALALVQQYDVVIDASDNPPTRYLISDACVVAGKPLISAAAVGTDGQLTVYCHGQDGPCYRCLFPECPAPENCSRCGDAGVLGPVPGVMGTLQALEALKILGGVGAPLAKKLLIFDGLQGRFTTVKLRGRSASCVACGTNAAVTVDNLAAYDYEKFTGQRPHDGPPAPLELLPDNERLTPAQLQERLQAAHASTTGATSPSPPSRPLIVLDVRPKTQFDIMALPGAVHHVPFEDFDAAVDRVLALCGMPPPQRAGDLCGADAEGSLQHAADPSGMEAAGARQLGGDPSGMETAGALQLGGDPSGVEAAGAAAPAPPSADGRSNGLSACGGEGTSGGAMGDAGRVGGTGESSNTQQGTSSRADGVDTTGDAERVGLTCGTHDTQQGTTSSSPNGVDAPADGDDAASAGAFGLRGSGQGSRPDVVVLCRRGNHSQIVVHELRRRGVHWAKDLIGGYTAWAQCQDLTMPVL